MANATWISTKAALPEKDERYLCVCVQHPVHNPKLHPSRPYCSVLTYMPDVKSWCDDIGWLPANVEILYWMPTPIPKLPDISEFEYVRKVTE